MKFESFYHRGQVHRVQGHKFRAAFYRILCKLVFQCDIPLSAKIDKRVHFCHDAFGCVINPNSIVGGGTVIQHSVTIGELNGHDAPIIGENVFIGARAMVLGNVHIGNNVKIGAGAIILHDIPDNCTVVGAPGRIVKKEDNT